jgi:hypothetical protein
MIGVQATTLSGIELTVFEYNPPGKERITNAVFGSDQLS